MTLKHRINFLLVIITLLTCSGLYGQVVRDISKYRGGGRPGASSGGNIIPFLGLGLSSYYGDLKKKFSLDTKIHTSFGARYMLNDRFSVRGELQYYQLEAKDSDGKDEELQSRNLSFKSSNIEFNVVGYVNLFAESVDQNRRNPYSRYKTKPYNVYGFAGLGVTTSNPRAQLNGTWYKLADYQTEGVKHGAMEIIVPFGFGAKYEINNVLGVSLEGGWRFSFTDYLDDVSTVYLDPNSFSDPLALALADRGPEIGVEPRGAGDVRGNPDNNDNYYIISLKIEYLGFSEIFGGSKSGGPRHGYPRTKPHAHKAKRRS